MKDYTVVRLLDRPELRNSMVEWFSAKWGIPRQAYEQSMDDCLSARAPVPQWYTAMAGDEIIGGLGVIENDFHERIDLAPNVCAVFVESPYRCHGVAGTLLDAVCRDMQAQGITTLYLLTNHVGFYERYGWEYFCPVREEGEATPARMYIHRAP